MATVLRKAIADGQWGREAQEAMVKENAMRAELEAAGIDVDAALARIRRTIDRCQAKLVLRAMAEDLDRNAPRH